MHRRHFLRSIGLLSAIPAVPAIASTATAESAAGKTVVKGKVSDQGKGIAGVVICDGYPF
jgi:hypothetical protein